MKPLLPLFTLGLTLLVTLPSHSQTIWSFDSHQEGNRVYFITSTYEQAADGEQRKAAPVVSRSSELLTLPDDVSDRQEQFFEPREDVFLPIIQSGESLSGER
ncbi:MAG: hypothetical protein ACFB4I_13525 [Cyanophyceae cyanobacterium]